MRLAEKVYENCRKIPRGKVTTYKELARACKSKAYRAVGQALNKNPHAPEVPCHRVVNSKGELHGYASGLEEKEKILMGEGIEIRNGKIDLEKYGYYFN
jgi:methylated-DNA-[protein]-cysteine S-methyltransferase